MDWVTIQEWEEEGEPRPRAARNKSEAGGLLFLLVTLLVTLTAFVVPVWKRYHEGDILHAVSQID